MIEDPSVDLLNGGKNNRVYRYRSRDGEFVLKEYFKHPGDPRDRCATEFAFISFLWKNGVRCVPEPIEMRGESGAALYEFVDGKHLTEPYVARECFDQA